MKLQRMSCHSVLSTIILLLANSIIADVQESPSNDESGIVVTTNSGPVMGIKQKTPSDTVINVFYGIPYAKPPVAELRFQPPKKIEPWSSTLQAVKPLPFCYQELPDNSNEMDYVKTHLSRPWTEDCLTLSIWAPSSKAEKAPVIFFIHGGGFILGHSLWFVDGSTLASEGVVVVTANYRLNVFGFLNLGHAEAPGNVGLMDQNLALQWVNENIEEFGGDSQLITLMGMSAGSASVGYHFLSSKSNGLFKRGIMMSGAPTNDWASENLKTSSDLSSSLLHKMNCPSQNISLALECLRRKHPEDILDASRTRVVLASDSFLPTVDGEFMEEDPSVAASSGKFNPGEVLIGSVIDEGAEFVKVNNPGLFTTQDGRLFRKDFKNVIKKSKRGLTDLQVEALNVVYTNWDKPDDPEMIRDAAKDIYSDAQFVCHINQFADQLAKAGHPVYRYEFGYKIVLPFLTSPTWMGAIHAMDQAPVLAPAQVFSHMKEEDILFSKKFRKQFINFVTSGDPNLSSEEHPEEPHWPQYNAGRQYKFFGNQSTIRKNLRAKRCAAWLEHLPLLNENNHC